MRLRLAHMLPVVALPAVALGQVTQGPVAISAGAARLSNGSLINFGQPLVGDAAGGKVGARLGIIPCVQPGVCYPNCDGSTGSPALTGNDFQCFINAYANNASYANCDGSTGSPALTGNDFQCFINAYVAGCP